MRALLLAPLLLGCRPDLGDPAYPDVEAKNPTTTQTDFLPGDVQYQAGDERLSVSLFYEGNFTEQVLIDDVTTHYYVWESTYSQAPSDDRIEGLESERYVIGDKG